MLLIEIAQMLEMARPAKICPDCGKSMAGNHYWYKGGWRCKKSSLADKAASKKEDKEEKADKKPAAGKKPAAKPAAKKPEPPKARHDDDDDDEKEHRGAVKGLEREAGEEQDPDVKTAEKEAKKAKKKSLSAITLSDVREIDADTEEEARKTINYVFSNATSEEKAKALRTWKALHKK